MNITCKLFLLATAIISSVQTLQFNSSGYFTIVQFTDIHVGPDQTKNELTQELQRNILSWVNPDLVIISGDAVRTSVPVASGWLEQQWNKFTVPMVEAQIPYAYTLGNHDDEGDLTRRQIVRLDQTNPYSLRNESEGIPDTTNFRIPVYASQNDSQLAAHLWMLDSGSYGCEDLPTGYGCIGSDVIDWYDQESLKVKAEHGTNVHHLAYFHIPLPEFLNVYNNQQIYGDSDDYVHCSVKNTEFFAAAKNNGDISAMFVGHDHNNDFGGWYEGIELVYGRKSGYNTYGIIHGARVVVLKENYDSDGNFVNVTRDHYVIDETGNIITTASTYSREGPKQTGCYYNGSSSADSLLSQLQKIMLAMLVILYLLY